jgi:DMSO/TMAO reductase YedYZ molybdopterin-dependent catalytic subunit
MGAHEAPARRPVTLGPPGVWARLLAFGRRWPDAYRHAHTLALYLLPLELLTGAILYFPRLHTALIPLLPAVLAVHVWAGVVFGLLLLVPLVVPLGRRLAATVDWRATVWLVGALSLTGLGLWLGAVPAILRSGAFTAHGVLSIGLLAWVLYHGLVRFETALRGGDPERTAERHGVLRRRTVLRELARALGSTFAATAVVGWVSTILASVRAQGPDGGSSGLVAGDGATATAASGQSRPLPGFQIYTVTSGFPGQAYEPSTFRLTVTGAVAQELSLSLDDLLQLPQVTETKSFHCVTGWVVPKVVWTGVRLADVLAKAQPQPVAGWISFDSFDGVYTDSLSLDQAQADGVLLAHHADGAPLAPEQGAPLRLVVPDMYGYKSVKWVGRLRLVGSRELGYWEQRGYGPDAYLGTINGWPAGQGIFGLFQ